MLPSRIQKTSPTSIHCGVNQTAISLASVVGQRPEISDQRSEVRGTASPNALRDSAHRSPALDKRAGRAEYRNDESTAALLNFRPIRFRSAPVTGFTRRPRATPPTIHAGNIECLKHSTFAQTDRGAWRNS